MDPLGDDDLTPAPRAADPHTLDPPVGDPPVGDPPVGGPRIGGHLTWCEVDTAALTANARTFRQRARPEVRLAPVVKSDGYGHGAVLAGRAFLAGGADWLCVHSLAEARVLRDANLRMPLLVLGPVLLDDLAEAVALDLRMVVYNPETVDRLQSLGLSARLHLKVETGNHRQGLDHEEALALADRIAQVPGLEIEGVSSHFANIEDTTDHRYAREQLHRFEATVAALRAAGHATPIRHIANSAATLLWPEQHFELTRVGLSSYGLWPSNETYLAAMLAGRGAFPLRPALTWKARIAQLKWVPEGAAIGYGCTFIATHRTRLAIVPVGYAEGYPRALSNLGHVLIGGRRAPVRGRVCMNILMADVTDISDVALEDEVVLLGRQGEGEVSAETFARWAGSINYEVVARIAAHVPRIAVTGVEHTPRADHTYRAPRP